MAKGRSSHMGIGRGRFRKALRAVLLARHSTNDLEALVRQHFGWSCAYCGISGEKERLQLDHLWPEAQGGCMILGNVVPCCPTCNSDRRDIPWQEFLNTSQRVRAARSPEEVQHQIQSISAYMEAHGNDTPPSWEDSLTTDELQLLEDFDLLLAAISDGALARAGTVKKAHVVFDRPAEMFEQMVDLARSYLKTDTV